MTMGAMALTRASQAPVSQVVHPRFEPPETTNQRTVTFHSFWAKACRASIARTRLLVMGKSSGQVASLVSR